MRKTVMLILTVMLMATGMVWAMQKKVTFDKQIQDAELVFVGQVISTEPIKVEQKYLKKVPIQNWIKVGFRITEIIKDKKKIVKKGDSVIYLHFEGGMGILVEDVPNFNINENVILILRTHIPVEEIPSFITAGGEKYEIIENDKDTTKSVKSWNLGRKISGFDKGEPIYDKKSSNITSKQFINEIKKIMKKSIK